jgi:hypothetical protein
MKSASSGESFSARLKSSSASWNFSELMYARPRALNASAWEGFKVSAAVSALIASSFMPLALNTVP